MSSGRRESAFSKSLLSQLEDSKSTKETLKPVQTKEAVNPDLLKNEIRAAEQMKPWMTKVEQRPSASLTQAQLLNEVTAAEQIKPWMNKVEEPPSASLIHSKLLNEISAAEQIKPWLTHVDPEVTHSTSRTFEKRASVLQQIGSADFKSSLKSMADEDDAKFN